MDIHKPKRWHGWPEFVKEIGTIVIGVLIAIGAEQAVEAGRHRAQVHEMSGKLRAESQENQGVVAYDVESLKDGLASADATLAAVTKGEAAAPALRKPDLFLPADAAWVSIRDSALLPIIPKLLADNAWKVDATNDYIQIKEREISQSTDRAEAALAVRQATPGDPELGRTARLRIAELRAEEVHLIAALAEFKTINQQMLRGERIDTARDLLKARARGRP